MSLVAVLIPVLDRPDRVRPLLESLADEPRARPVFVLSPDDRAEHVAVGESVNLFRREPERYVPPLGIEFVHPPSYLPWDSVGAVVVSWEPGPGDYARKINEGYRRTDEPWLLLGADDLRFHPGWLDAALAVAEETGCGVIGTNDLGNPSVMAGRHATHPLVARWYVEECGASADGPGIVYHEGYDHQFCDTELIAVATGRGCFAPAPLSVVEHLHPFWHKGDGDATYDKGQRAGKADQALFNSRRRLWR